MLSQRLRELEREGLLHRDVLASSPVRVEYHLTDKGRALGPAVPVA
jgi:DNA-binding HxlR family transcriptional regulator